MDPVNDPGRDEYGLPPVDIEIPDDARDLDRDVQAYYRELGARRRHLRVRRLTSPLTRHGMVIPLVAACLALSLLAGSLLTALTGRQVPLLPGRGSPGPAQAGSASRGPPGPAQGGSASRGRPLPDVQVFLNGKQVELRGLAPAVLAWVPAGCTACGAVLRQLARHAASAHVPIYFVGNGRAVPDLAGLARRAGRGHGQDVVEDTRNALGLAYAPAGVTAILAHADGSVADPDVVRRVSSPSGLRRFETRLQALASAGPGAAAGSPAPARQPAPLAS